MSIIGGGGWGGGGRLMSNAMKSIAMVVMVRC